MSDSIINDQFADQGVQSIDQAHLEELYLQAIERLQKAKGTEAEQDADLNFLLKYSPDPHISDYIYHHQPELSAEEILTKATRYEAIRL